MGGPVTAVPPRSSGPQPADAGAGPGVTVGGGDRGEMPARRTVARPPPDGPELFRAAGFTERPRASPAGRTPVASGPANALNLWPARKWLARTTRARAERRIDGNNLHRTQRHMAARIFAAAAGRRRLSSIALLLLGLPAPFAARAQQVPGAPSEAQVVERLRASGLTREQVRARLQAMGRDPALADRYFDAIERGTTAPAGAATGDVVGAMQSIGVLLRDSAGVQPRADTVVPLTAPLGGPRVVGGLPIFGQDIFRVGTSQFQAVANGPVDPDYRLGPGDQLVAVLTGDVQLSYNLDVSREGTIVIPDVGQVEVAGLTLREVEDRLYERLGRVYSGVGRGEGASTQFGLSLGRLRSNQIFMIGEVTRPGAYQVSSVATVFNALYQARGPNDNGSFRRIEVRRGGRTIRVVDVYEYLLRGDSRDDIRLEQGDVIFVPLAGLQVGIQGSVRRAAIFELKEGEGMRDLLSFAGGLQAEASLARVQIDRVLPPEQRRPGVERALVDVDVRALLAGGAAPRLYDRDIVSVFAVTAERRNRVTVMGEVRRPGIYEWQPGQTLWGVIERAEGLGEDAYTARAHVYRYNPADGSRSLLRIPLYAATPGVRQDIQLSDRDSVVVFSRAALRNSQAVSIAGFVKHPGNYVLAEGMTARDLVLAAGGFVTGADESVAELARLPDPSRRGNVTSQVSYIPLGDRAVGAQSARPAVDDSGSSAGRAGERGAGEWVPGPGEVRLQDGDVLFVRKSPGYEGHRFVAIGGEVAIPGDYALGSRQERLVDVIRRAGGTTPEAYLPGLRVSRGGKLVGTDYERALRRPNSRYNILLEPLDSITVPTYDPTVLVTGAVNFSSRVLYDPRLTLFDYVSRSGGFAPAADRGRVSVQYPDGERYTVQRRLLISSVPRVRPGSTVFVPTRPEGEKTNWGEIITRAVGLFSTAATLWIAIDRITQ
ncbi:protein involved in polysaccharide export, contains SLBB domain of the beta-grasp fold [bacterium JGI 053]|nr:protein involved in polysaccharide export, contains SLBB domain of the beta-grasp fold [bacterium JGI 053]